MRKIILNILVGSLALAGGKVHAAPLTPGDLVIYRVGDGSANLVNTGNPVFLDEYTTNGTLVQSIAMPTTASGANSAFWQSGTANSGGLLTLSTNGQYLMLTGYGITNGANITSATALAVPRVVGRVDMNGVIDTTTALTNISSGDNVRSAVSTDGTNIWVGGNRSSGASLGFTTLGSKAVTQLAASSLNLRQLDIFNGQLYGSSGSDDKRIFTIGTGLPTSGSPQTFTNLPGLTTNVLGSGSSPYAFSLFDLDNTVPGLDTLYFADDNGGGNIFKFSLVGGTWTSNGVIATANVRGLTGRSSGTNVFLYATTGGNASSSSGTLFQVTDVSGYNGFVSGSATVLANTISREVFRGIVLLPPLEIATVPEPSVTLFSAAGLTALLIFRRRARSEQT